MLLILHIAQADGNLLDAASFASYVALNTALVPKVTVIASESTGVHDDFEIDGDLALADHIQGASMVSLLSVLILTAYVYNCYIGILVLRFAIFSGTLIAMLVVLMFGENYAAVQLWYLKLIYVGRYTHSTTTTSVYKEYS
jgi:hypothetical protein